MLSHYLRTMETTFIDRLKQAALYRRLEWSPTVIGKALGLPKQTVHRWMQGGEPKPENVFRIADLWEINARWLATGEGSILALPDSDALNKQETEILTAYRSAQADGKSSLRTLARVIGRGTLAVLLPTILSIYSSSDLGAATALHNVNTHNSVSKYTLIDKLKLFLRWLIFQSLALRRV